MPTHWEQVGVNDTTRALGADGAGVGVAIFDTPIDLTHPDLDVLRPSLLHVGAKSVGSSHGTHVAGTVAGFNGIGAAERAQLYDISVFNGAGVFAKGYTQTGEMTLRTPLAAAVRVGASIANMSFGYGGGLTLSYDQISSISSFRRHVLAVKAAGNEGVTLRSVRSIGQAQSRLDNFMLVGSVDGDNMISTFSNTPGEACFASYASGAWRCREQDKYKYFFIVAPGEDIVSTVPGGGHAALSGTSMASPHVAGAAALLQGRWSFLKSRPQATANILFRSATDLGAAGVDEVYGWGLLNVEQAFQPIGQTQLYSSSKTYPAGTVSRYSGTGTIDHMIGWRTRVSSVSVFDEYQRDFKVSAAAVSEEARSGLGSRMGDYFASFGTMPLAAAQSVRISDDIEARFTASSGAEAELAVNPMGPLARSDFDQNMLDRDRAAAWSFQASSIASGASAFAGHRAGTEALGFTTLGAMRPEGLGGASATLENPVLGFATSGNWGGAALSPMKGVSIVAGFAESAERDYFGTRYGAGAAVAGIRFQPADGIDLGIAATQLSETDGLFGATGAGVLSLADRYATNAVTLTGAWRPAADWQIAGALTFAETRQKGAGTDLLSFDGTVLSNAATIGVSRGNLVAAGDRLSFTAALPLAAFDGRVVTELASHLDQNGNLVTERYERDLSKAGARQLDLTLGYSAQVLGAAELAVAGFATLNDHATDRNEFGGLAAVRMKY